MVEQKYYTLADNQSSIKQDSQRESNPIITRKINAS